MIATVGRRSGELRKTNPQTSIAATTKHPELQSNSSEGQYR